MSVHEFTRRHDQAERREDEIASLLAFPTKPVTGPDVLEEHAEMLVRHARQLRELAALWRKETA